MAVRFLNLRAGAIIKQHRDMELAFEKGMARLHFPVFTNTGVEFYIENDRVILQEGECWYINANLPHRVSNNGSTDRIHLIVDCEVSDWLKEIVLSSPQISTREEDNSQDILKMIEALGHHHTEGAAKLIEKLKKELKQTGERMSQP